MLIVWQSLMAVRRDWGAQKSFENPDPPLVGHNSRRGWSGLSFRLDLLLGSVRLMRWHLLRWRLSSAPPSPALNTVYTCDSLVLGTGTCFGMSNRYLVRVHNLFGHLSTHFVTETALSSPLAEEQTDDLITFLSLSKSVSHYNNQMSDKQIKNVRSLTFVSHINICGFRFLVWHLIIPRITLFIILLRVENLTLQINFVSNTKCEPFPTLWLFRCVLWRLYVV